MKHVVDIEDIIILLDKILEFDSMNFKDIEFHYNGVKVDINDETYDWWKFVGMSNHSFIEYAWDRSNGSFIDCKFTVCQENQ